MHNKQLLHANGKLLLTGEYLVMQGATALALPLVKGQALVSEESGAGVLSWTAIDTSGVWFNGTYSLQDFSALELSDAAVGHRLEILLKQAASLNPDHSLTSGRDIKTSLNFDRHLGLGSSSTLLALVADLFEVSKYALHQKVSRGSGYDLACSDSSSPLLYTRTGTGAVVKHVNFNPSFSSAIFFIYSGKKQDTESEVSRFHEAGNHELTAQIEQISNITYQLLQCKDLSTFISLINLHEVIIEGVLKRESIKRTRFQDFDGAIKSLGAWGGDFILAASAIGEKYIREYFLNEGVKTIYRFDDIVLNEKVKSDHETIIRF